jgi:DNA polymerase I-like protein with 3'-5' exonuclease and polymerase domains
VSVGRCWVDKPITVDFETKAIQNRPKYPPEPVGVSIKYPGRPPRYFAWGHPTGNNTTREQAYIHLSAAWRSKSPKLFQNAKFDLDVAEVHFGLRLLSWDEFHDTMFLLFLKDPHSKTLSLKPSAERYLDMPPEERDAVKDWILANIPGIKPSEWGAYISEAPGQLVGKYANGDTNRTEKLFDYLYPLIEEAGMVNAYNRERRLLPILLRNERVGIRVDVPKLEVDLKNFRTDVKKAEQWLFKFFGREFNLDSDTEKADALQRSGVVTNWVMTPTGRRSTAKKNMTWDMFNDKRVASVLGYRDRLCTCIRMFGDNWLELASTGDGHVHTHWNQVAQDSEAGKKIGTRTGRPSTSNPNFLNVSKTWYDKDDGYAHPKFLKVRELPLMRQYLLPDKGEIWLHRDYNQQEVRCVAHFESGALLQAYLDNPRMDVHSHIASEIERLRGMPMQRRPVKITVFRRIYGGGVPATMQALRCSALEAKTIMSAVGSVLPGLKELEKEIKKTGKAGEPIVTWGGRLYYCEPPMYSKRFKRHMTFEYKLLNYLAQGSASDATKEAQIRYDDVKKNSRFLVAVYDETNVSAPPKAVKSEMKLLKEAMESVEFDLPMLTDGKTGPNWADIDDYKD